MLKPRSSLRVLLATSSATRIMRTKVNNCRLKESHGLGAGASGEMRYIALLRERELQKKNLREAALKEAKRFSALPKREFKYETLYLIAYYASSEFAKFAIYC